MKTKAWNMGINICITAIMSATVLFLSGCDNPAMESNETEYMYSDLSIERAEWEIVTEGMIGMGGMTYMYITLDFDEPVRAERDTAATWQPFTLNYDSMGSPVTKTLTFAASLPSARGAETALYRFSVMVTASDTADMFSNVKLSYTAPDGFKIVSAFDDKLKNFSDRPLAKKETGGGMGGM
jgi:hypothetical protein